jgi:S-(hydroxymethyl)glutathione dehydrogenase/alcohol dehydrogenase
VKVLAAGVCHTDLDSLSWGKLLILGHEGAGIVERIGTRVPNLCVDDRVLLNWAIPCGSCFQCQRGAENICENKPSVPAPRFRHASGQSYSPSVQLGTMSTHTLVPWQALTLLNGTIPFASATLLGCGVMTGFGFVVNVAKVETGSSVVVLGAGGVGLSALQAARHCGAKIIIAIDINPGRLELGKKFGATHTILADVDDPCLLQAAATVRLITERGADYAFECTAIPELGAAPLAMVRNGGTAVGVSGIEKVIPIDMELFEWDKQYINPLYGQCRPAVDFPKLLTYMSGAN